MQHSDRKNKYPHRARIAVSMLLVFGLAVSAGRAVSGTATDSSVFEPIIEIDLRQDSRTARDHNKYLMVMFVKDGCSPCEKMKREVLSDPAVQAYFQKHFLSYQANIYGDLPILDAAGVALTEKTYAAREGIWGTPAFHFFDEHGQLLHKHIGAMSKQDFVRLGQRVVMNRN